MPDRSVWSRQRNMRHCRFSVAGGSQRPQDGTGDVLFLSACSNAGDTIETVKHLFQDLLASGITRLRVRGIGITGSARYQVQQALARLYPTAADRLTVLVENYAHARGSIDVARRRIAQLVEKGEPVNRDLCVLVDIGGEDTKISTIALAQAELFANAMNLKCSAGTGSLMDTFAALFNIPAVATACADAFAAPRAWASDRVPRRGLRRCCGSLSSHLLGVS